MIDTPRAKRERQNQKAAKRQTKIAERRKEAGLKLVKTFLDNDSYKLLLGYAEDLGYTKSELAEGKEGRIEKLSQILATCVHKAAGGSQLYKSADSKECIERASVRAVAKYRKKKGDSPAEVAELLNACKYPMLVDSDSSEWTAKSVKALFPKTSRKKPSKPSNKKKASK